MPFDKGKPKTGGRTKGTKNKVNADLKAKVLSFIDASYEEVLKSFTRLSSKEKIEFWLKLLPYVLPKANEVEKEYNLDSLTSDEQKVIENIDRQHAFDYTKIYP